MIEKEKWKKFFSYYKPYKKMLFSDLFFSFLGAIITLILPLIIRYITTNVIYKETSTAINIISILIIFMVGLIILEVYCNFFITYYGHIMGAKMEFDMRNEIFQHYQKLSFNFFNKGFCSAIFSKISRVLFTCSIILSALGAFSCIITLISSLL